MTTTFWWIRHGPTHAKTMVGWSDLPADLSDVAAIKRLSDYLPKDALVISSDLIRASTDNVGSTSSRLVGRFAPKSQRDLLRSLATLATTKLAIWQADGSRRPASRKWSAWRSIRETNSGR